MTSIPLTELRFSVVGPGRVGSSLAGWLTAAGADLVSVGARSPEKASRLAARLGAYTSPLTGFDSAGQDLLVIAVPDAAISTVARDLSSTDQADVALHVSGACGAEVLAPLRGGGTAVGSLHPLRAFAAPSTAIDDAAGTAFGIDGDVPARRLAESIATGLGGSAIQIDSASRPLYHLAASIAAGGVVTLLGAAHEIARQLDLPREVTEGYFDLALQALEAARNADHPADAVTGPVARGDVEVVQEQFDELRRSAPELVGLFAALARETRRQRRLRGDDSPDGESLDTILDAVPIRGN